MQGDIIQTNTTRGLTGYGSALLVKDTNDTLYSLYLPLGTTPSVAGTPESFTFDILTDPAKGKLIGKPELDSKDIDFMLHRDNVRRAKKFANKVCDFLVVYQDGTGYTFSAETRVKSNDAEGDILYGTITFSPLSASELLDDVRDLIRPTIQFTGTIPAREKFSSTKTTMDINVKTNLSGATITATSNSNQFTVASGSGSGADTTTLTDGKLTIATASGITAGATGIITIVAKDSTDKYASWETTIAVEYE